MISVAMTTYNGKKYIISQLDSIRKQTVKVDEVIIYDDCSEDGTFEIISDYINRWRLSSWVIKKNDINMGWKRNFYNVLNMTKGDIVFFCDQDDIWDVSKIEQMSNVMNKNDMEVLCCTTGFIDGDDRKFVVDRTVLPYGAKKGCFLEYNDINDKFIYTIMPGCTMAIKRTYIVRLECYLKNEMINCSLPHDALFWKIATLEGKAAILHRDLIDYRIHANNSSSPQVVNSYKRKTRTIRNNEINTNKAEINLIKYVYSELGNDRYNDFLDDLISFCEWRIGFINKKEIRNIANMYRYYRNIKMFLGDIVVAFGKKGK